jgi:hypothetical protein
VTHLPHISQEFLDAIITKGKPDFTLDNASGDTPLICQVRAGKVFNAALIFKHLGPAVDIPSLVSIEDVDGDTILHKLAEVDEVDALSAILAGSSALLSRVNTSVRDSLSFLGIVSADSLSGYDNARHCCEKPSIACARAFIAGWSEGGP